MNIPVKVRLAVKDAVTVMDDELHALLHQGVLEYDEAVKALKAAGATLDKKLYPWLKDEEEGTPDGGQPSHNPA